MLQVSEEWRVVSITIVFDIRERRQVILRIMDVMKIDVISKKYPAQLSMAETIVHYGLGERHQQMGSYSRQKKQRELGRVLSSPHQVHRSFLHMPAGILRRHPGGTPSQVVTTGSLSARPE